MDNKLEIRKAQPSDAVAMKGCVESAYRHYIYRMGKPPGPMLDDYTDVIQQHMVSVAEVDGEVAGVLVLVPS